MANQAKSDTDLQVYVFYTGRRGLYRLQPRGVPSKEDQYCSWGQLPRWAQQWFQYERWNMTTLDGRNVVDHEREKRRTYQDDCEGSVGFRVSCNRRDLIPERRTQLEGFPPWVCRLAELPAEKFEREVNRIIATGELYE